MSRASKLECGVTFGTWRQHNEAQKSENYVVFGSHSRGSALNYRVYQTRNKGGKLPENVATGPENQMVKAADVVLAHHVVRLSKRHLREYIRQRGATWEENETEEVTLAQDSRAVYSATHTRTPSGLTTTVDFPAVGPAPALLCSSALAPTKASGDTDDRFDKKIPR
ncbi:hypothetical protein VE03_06831 [Pseudogymnoascus sp. 23342-1-I1]|nr:hypothetical protein VE03_06831 [Pseudogymnoascus sp. 23342-1-I1]